MADVGTVIHTNGSKWNGEPPDSIEQLLAILAREPLDPTFDGEHVFEVEGRPEATMYWGNFAHLSHVFRIETTDLKTKILLRRAIRANLGSEAYRVAWERWGWKKPVERQAERRLAKWKRRAAA